ncbi:MAG: hypothetical protein JW809_02500 [Pirellulales bacterium]|nr:hypothetical protein [Pirellulales bacterium]
MDDPTSPTSSRSDRTDELARSWGRQRGQIEQFLAAQRERLQTAHKHLAAQVEQIAKDLAHAQAENRRVEEDLDGRYRALDDEAKTVAKLKEALQAAQADWQAAQDRAASHQAQLAQRIERSQEELGQRMEQFAQRRAELAEAEAAVAHEKQSVSLLRQQQEEESQRLGAKAAELEAAGEELASLRARTEGQRRRIAREIEAQRAADRKDLARRRTEIEQLATDRLDALRQELLDATAQRDQLEAELEAARAAQARREAEWVETRRRYEAMESRQAETSAEAPAAAGISDAAWEELRAQRDALDDKLAKAQEEAEDLRQQLGQASGGDTDADDYRRRYEMAMEDLRDLKRRNAELESQAGAARGGGAARDQAFGNVLDWETQKQRMLAALEADFDENNEDDVKQRLKIEEVIRATQRVVEEKDREIAELRQLLECQTGQVGQMAVGAAAFSEIVDQDAIIQEERENLKRLQEEVREKLRQAEIDISIERAKIARQRTELEAKTRHLELDKTGPEEKAPEPEKPARGRWLSRLGLKDEPPEKDG